MSRDYEELLESFNEHGVRYLLIGAHAVAFYGRPRATKDLDVLIDPAPANVDAVLEAIRDFFGGYDLGLSPADLTAPERVVQLGVSPTRIDILSSLLVAGPFSELWERRSEGRFGEVPAHYISRPDLIRAKSASERLQDKADVELLRRME